MYHVTEFEGMGRGLQASQDLRAGQLLFTAELLVLNAADTIKVNETDLQFYTFKYNETQDCLVLGDGELFNHSDKPNVGYKLMKWGGIGRLVMAFYVLENVRKGDQLFIDYNADVAVDTSKYKVNL